MWLSRSSLRGYLGAAAPRFRAAFHQFFCGSGTGPGLSRARSLRHSLLMTWSLVLWPGFRVRSTALRLLPMVCHGWGFVYVSIF